PDWVLMDIMMERVDGITATREIRRAFPDARIVIVTNFDDAKFRDAAREAGAGYYVPKENLMAVRAVLLQKDAARNSAL
ncbi:MAG: response regulator, partial [Blastocatellia bacterium]|nr:response regulator [Blastocatellia bacterium]